MHCNGWKREWEKPMLVLKFGVRNILSGSDAAHAEMRDAHRLYNALVAVERWRRREWSRIRSRHVPGLSQVEEAYEQLSEWIGEHAGPSGERGEIREKRRKATARSGVPTKRVDATGEIDTIAELKAWRKEAGAQAKPLRTEFDAMLHAARQSYDARTRGVDLAIIEQRDRMRADSDADRSSLAELSERIDAASRKTNAKGAANARVLAEMLAEPQWSAAWRDVAMLDDMAHRLRQWVGDAHALNHGTYIAVSDAVEQAGKRPRPRPDGEPRKPRERPAFSSGRLRKMGWQLKGTVTWADICAGRCPSVAVTEIVGTGERRRAMVRIRISTAERGVSEHVVLDVVIHRPVPDDTRVRWVYLVPEERPHGRHEYSVQFTAEPTAPLIVRAPGSGHARVDLCWTKDSDTLIVARINGEPLRLPVSVPARLTQADAIRGASDRHFDVARAEMVARLPALSERVQRACDGIVQWRNHSRLARASEMLRESVPRDMLLAEWAAWRDERLRSHVDLLAPFAEYAAWAAARGVAESAWFPCWLETWRRKDKHLEQYADGLRRGATGCRRDFYRVTSARLSERFATYELGGAVDLEALALRDKSEDRPKELHQAARHNRTIAAVSELKEAIGYVFGKDRERCGADVALPVAAE